MASLASKALETQFNFLLRNSQILSQHVKSTRFLDRCSKIFCSSHLGERGYVTGTSIPITTTPFPEFDDVPDLKCHKDLYNLSLAKPDLFWGKLARSRISWFKDFDQVKDCDLSQGKIKWFVNGKLNVSVNCVDRHYDVSPDRVALIWEKDEPGSHEFVTYRELFQLMNRIGNLLKSHGVKKGDRVAIYLPKSPVAVASMLACARIGAVHSVVFAGFSADSLADRINDAQVETVITADQGVRGGKIIELKRLVDEAVKKCPGVRQVFVARRTGGDVPMGKLDIPLDKALEEQSDKLRPEEMDSEDFLFLLYTSGSTGKPKGLAHTQAGYLTYTNVTHKHVFDYRPGELFGCVADIGWITGHSYVVYGPLSNGATTLLFESTPTYPDPGRYWEMTERLGLHHIYLSPTALRLLLKSGDSWVKKYDLSSLRVLGCVGEPLNHDAWEWYYNVVGEKRCDIIDTWWQTETGGICIAPRPSDPGAEIRSAMPMRPFFGIDPLLMDQKGNELMGADESGSLYLRSPWPGMARTIWGDHQRYISTYLASVPGMYLTGDGAHRVDGEFYQITGRMDDVINTTGHRLGTAELEDVVADHDAVSECAVVGFPHDIKGEGIYLYVVLKDGVTESEEDIRADINALIKSRIAGYATADMIQFSPGLPRTRSGKIMRRILRKVAANQSDELGDTSTLADPSVVEVILQNHKKIVKSGT